MKLVEATWEKRNLGLDTLEITVEKTDTPEDVLKIQDELSSYAYVVVRIPCNQFAMVEHFSQAGFLFVEAMLDVSLTVADAVLPPVLARIDQNFTYEKMNAAALSRLNAEVSQSLFHTDRISVDPYFSAEASAKRYRGWLADELARGTEIYELITEDTPVGFFTFRVADHQKSAHLALGGMYPNYQKAGYGFEIVHKPAVLAKSMGLKKLTTAVSTNNLDSIKMHQLVGFQVVNIHHIFIKHNA